MADNPYLIATPPPDETPPQAATNPYVVGPAPAPTVPSHNPGSVTPGPGDAWAQRELNPSLMQRTQDFVMGKRQFDLPELLTGAGQKIDAELKDAPKGVRRFSTPLSKEGEAYQNVARGLTFAPDEASQRDIITQNFPSAKFDQDIYGNTTVRIKNDRYYLNPSGLSRTDLQQGEVSALTTGIGAMAGAGAGGLVAGTIGRVAGAGLGSAASELGTQAAVQGMGSRQPTNMGRIEMMGGFGAAGEAIASPIANFVIHQLSSSPRYFASGSLTTEGEAIARQAGLDPTMVNNAIGTEWQRLARDTNDPAAALRQAQARTLPVPGTLTTGQATRDPTAFADESVAKTGGKGPAAQQTMLANQQEQQTMLQANRSQIQGGLSGGVPQVPEPGVGGAQAQGALLTRQGAEKANTDASYAAARAAPNKAFFATDDINNLVGQMRQSVANYDPTAYPNLMRQIGNLEQFVAPKPGVSVTGVNIDAMELWRRRAVSAAQNASSPTEGAAIKNMISTYDNQVDTTLRTGLLKGDPNTIDLWQNATAARARYGQIFGQDDVINELTSRMADGSRRLVVSPDEAVNYIFGRGNIGATKGLVPDLSKLRNILGPNSPEWNSVREEGWLRLMKGQQDGQPFNAGAYSRNLNEAMRTNAPAMRLLYTPDELFTFRQFGQVARNISQAPAIVGNVNPSGTAVAVGRRIAGSFGPMGRTAMALAEKYLNVEGAANMGAATKMGAAARGALPPAPAALPAGAASGPTATIGTSLMDRSRPVPQP